MKNHTVVKDKFYVHLTSGEAAMQSAHFLIANLLRIQEPKATPDKDTGDAVFKTWAGNVRVSHSVANPGQFVVSFPAPSAPAGYIISYDVAGQIRKIGGQFVASHVGSTLNNAGDEACKAAYQQALKGGVGQGKSGLMTPFSIYAQASKLDVPDLGQKSVAPAQAFEKAFKLG